jgi:hypothetical protein
MINKDINKYKAIFFDFDDTLCIHPRRNQFLPSQYNSLILSKEYTWQDCHTNRHMKAFMDLADKVGIPMFLISATTSSVHADAKIVWVEKNYGIKLGNFCVGKREAKVWMMDAYCDANNIPKRQVLFVDDCWDSLSETEIAGYHSCCPMEIVDYIENLK